MRVRRQTRIVQILFVLVAAIGVGVFVLAPNTTLQQGLAAAATVIAAVAIWFQMKREKDVAVGEFILTLNTTFNENPSNAAVYQKLVNGGSITDEDQYAVMTYLTFFETCYLLHNRAIVDLSLLDDLFRYRFFTAMHHPQVQEIEIVPDRSSYLNLITLYDLWRAHIKKLGRWDDFASEYELDRVLGDEYALLLHQGAPSRG